MFDGILVVDKPAGWTSHDVVGKLRKVLKTKRVGHTGTLDPFATGVLVMLVGKATRLAQFLDKDRKEYEADVNFGFETDTGDRTGEPKTDDPELKAVSAAEIEAVLPQFRGAIEQTPPMYSAKKIQGKKLYELARKGVEIERKPIAVKIYELDLLERKSAPAESHRLSVACSAGTYIRTLAEDIGRRIGAGAHLAELRRTAAGKFAIAQAASIEELEQRARENTLDEIFVSMNEAVSHLAQAALSAEEITRTRNGMKLSQEIPGASDGENVRLTSAENELVAVGVYAAREKTVQPKIVLV